jgi:outer membrane protein assembly factor BamB
MILISLVLFCYAYAADWPMASLNHEAIRDQKDNKIYRSALSNLHYKWTSPTVNFVTAQPIVENNIVYVGDYGGRFYFIHSNGTLKCSIQLLGTIINAAALDNKRVFVGTWGNDTDNAHIYALNKDNCQIIWDKYGPDYTEPLDQFYTAPLRIKDQLIVAYNPNEESSTLASENYTRRVCCVTRGHLLSLDPRTGTIKWRFDVLPHSKPINVTLNISNVYTGNTSTYVNGPSGGGIWNTQLVYAEQLGLILFSTGQAYSPNSTGKAASGTEAIFAIKAKNGKEVWRRNVRELQTGDNFVNDVWTSVNPISPYYPRDLDLGNGLALYKTRIPGKHGKDKNQWVVATGDKRGIWYVLEAETGAMVNNKGYNTLPILPSVTLMGGFNLQSATGKIDGKWVSFGVLRASKNNVTCVAGNTPSYPSCTALDTLSQIAHIVAISADGKTELGRFTRQSNFLGGILVVNEIVVIRDIQNRALVFLDGRNVSNVLYELDLSAHLTSYDYGSSMALSNGNLYFGSGLFTGATRGVICAGI